MNIIMQMEKICKIMSYGNNQDKDRIAGLVG